MLQVLYTLLNFFEDPELVGDEVDGEVPGGEVVDGLEHRGNLGYHIDLALILGGLFFSAAAYNENGDWICGFRAGALGALYHLTFIDYSVLI